MVSEAVIEAALKDTVSQNFHFPGFVTLLRAKINFRYYLPILFFLVANFLLQFIHACVFRAGSFKNEEEFFFHKTNTYYNEQGEQKWAIDNINLKYLASYNVT